MSINFVPLPLYTPLYYSLILAVAFFTYIDILRKGLSQNYISGILLFALVIVYLGLRPISGAYFNDMGTYNRIFMQFKEGYINSYPSDPLFYNVFVKYSSQVLSANVFFLCCSIMYVTPMYVIAKKWFKQYWFYVFLMLVGSFSFWAYGVNGIRNGIATSFMLLAISREKRISQVLWMVIAIGFHKTMMLPALGLVITWFYNKPKAFFYFWLTAIPLSLLFSGLWTSMFAALLPFERVEYLTQGNVKHANFSSTGFRWDFLVYSATGVFAGWYYLYKKKFKDPLYFRLFNVYLFANTFWILVIRANFSNRFAYLSWFLLALVIAYPWLKYRIEKNQFKSFGMILLAYVAFTFILNVIIYG